ncbi:hypothetical protein AGLY_005382 [Aphis glycines]|uniref:Uncharacterized protein n=1 Tax=Aphis glycines TaxID=307491 RepID=A0A6G0TUC0_APHGL|nr:hypothetical protein AGLY_005382 [Aphis glycines]
MEHFSFSFFQAKHLNYLLHHMTCYNNVLPKKLHCKEKLYSMQYLNLEYVVDLVDYTSDVFDFLIVVNVSGLTIASLFSLSSSISISTATDSIKFSLGSLVVLSTVKLGIFLADEFVFLVIGFANGIFPIKDKLKLSSFFSYTICGFGSSSFCFFTACILDELDLWDSSISSVLVLCNLSLVNQLVSSNLIKIHYLYHLFLCQDLTDFLNLSFLYLSRSLSLSLSLSRSFSKKDFSTLGSGIFSLDLSSLIASYLIVLDCDKDFSNARVLFVSHSISQFGSFAIKFCYGIHCANVLNILLQFLEKYYMADTISINSLDLNDFLESVSSSSETCTLEDFFVLMDLLPITDFFGSTFLVSFNISLGIIMTICIFQLKCVILCIRFTLHFKNAILRTFCLCVWYYSQNNQIIKNKNT